jgi:hypothetical protein
MSTDLSPGQKLQLLRGPKGIDHSDVLEISEIVFRETGKTWALADVLASALAESTDASHTVAMPKWAADGMLEAILRLLALELSNSEGKGKLAKMRARIAQDRIHLVRTIKVLKLVDEGLTREQAYASVAEATEDTALEVREDAIKASVRIVEKHLSKEDHRYYLPLMSDVRKLVVDLGDFDDFADWPEES